MKIKTSQNVEIILSLTEVVFSCASRKFMSLNAFHEIKLLAKISEFIVFHQCTKTVCLLIQSTDNQTCKLAFGNYYKMGKCLC